MQIINQRMMKILLFLGFGLAIPAGSFADSGATESGKEATQFQAVSLGQLEDERGTGGVIDVTTLANVQINGELTGNVAINSVNGNNIIDEGSFTEASGLFSIIQNTGNNVLIQDSTTVNVTILP